MFGIKIYLWVCFVIFCLDYFTICWLSVSNHFWYQVFVTKRFNSTVIDPYIFLKGARLNVYLEKVLTLFIHKFIDNDLLNYLGVINNQHILKWHENTNLHWTNNFDVAYLRPALKEDSRSARKESWLLIPKYIYAELRKTLTFKRLLPIDNCYYIQRT